MERAWWGPPDPERKPKAGESRNLPDIRIPGCRFEVHTQPTGFYHTTAEGFTLFSFPVAACSRHRVHWPRDALHRRPLQPDPRGAAGPVAGGRDRGGGRRAPLPRLAPPARVQPRAAGRRAAGGGDRVPLARGAGRPPPSPAAGRLPQRGLEGRGVPRLRRPHAQRRVPRRPGGAAGPGRAAAHGVPVRGGALVALPPAPDRRPADLFRRGGDPPAGARPAAGTRPHPGAVCGADGTVRYPLTGSG